MSIQQLIRTVCERNNGNVYTRTLATQMRDDGGYRSTVGGNLGKAYYQLHKAEGLGYLSKRGLVWVLTDAGKAWCGLEGAAVNVANTHGM